LLLLTLGMVIDWTVFFLMIIHKYINWTRYIYIPIEYSVLMVIFSIWQEDRKIKKILLWSIPVFIGICIISALYRKDFTFFDGLTISLSCLIYAAISLFTLVGLLYKNVGNIYKNYIFWVCSALVLYGASGVIFYSLTNYYPSYTPVRINAGIASISNIFYMIGFLCYRPR
jgi:hypothetical protein